MSKKLQIYIILSIDHIMNISYNINIIFIMKNGFTMEKEDLINKIIELQRLADHSWRQYQLIVWLSLPLTIAQVKSLFFISNQKETNPGKLAEALGVTPTNATGIIDRLVKKGLVSRTENPENRRMLLLRATGEGEELVAKLRERRKGHMAEILEPMNEEELMVIVQGLDSLVKAIQNNERRGKDIS
jgi:DNA-binding MarR family transcriptional regulator